MDAFLVQPEGARGAVVLLQEIFGVNAAMRAKARDLAAAGLTVLVPDLFWRLERRVDLGYGEADRQRGFALMQKYDQVRSVADVRAAVAWLRQRAPESRPGLVGFCLGGRIAVLAGAANADVSAVISLYGVRLDLCADQLRAIACPFQLHVGDKDAHVPAEHVAAVSQIVAGRGDAEIFVYPAAQHGFFNRQRDDVYDAPAAALARTRILDLLARAR
jgi:carboxymethylenebutenolidase